MLEESLQYFSRDLDEITSHPSGQKSHPVTLSFTQEPGSSDGKYEYKIGHRDDMSGDDVLKTYVSQCVLTLLSIENRSEAIVSEILSKSNSW